jgi:hypothetical protein
MLPPQPLPEAARHLRIGAEDVQFAVGLHAAHIEVGRAIADKVVVNDQQFAVDIDLRPGGVLDQLAGASA